MNTTMKLTLVAGALALAVSGQANAAIAGNSVAAPGGDLVLSIWDTTSATSYTEDLGINLQSFVSQATAGFNQTWNTVADANLTSFLAGATASTTTWNVVALQGSGAATTSYAAITTAASQPGLQTNSAIKSYVVGPNQYFTAVNLDAATGATSVYEQNATVNTNYALGYAGNTQFSSNFGGKAITQNNAAIGSSLNVFYLKATSASTGAADSVTAFSNVGAATATAASFALSNAGVLTYTGATVAAVPEPGEWLLMLSGLALLGFIATRRKNASSVSFA